MWNSALILTLMVLILTNGVIAFVLPFHTYRNQCLQISPKKLYKDLALKDIRYELEEDESIDDALRYFRQACSQSGHLQALRIKDQFENKAEKRKRKREQARFLDSIDRKNERYEKALINGPYAFDKN